MKFSVRGREIALINFMWKLFILCSYFASHEMKVGPGSVLQGPSENASNNDT